MIYTFSVTMLHYRYHILHHPFVLHYTCERRTLDGSVIRTPYTVTINGDFRANARELWAAFRDLPEHCRNHLAETMEERCPVGWARWQRALNADTPEDRRDAEVFIPSRRRRVVRRLGRAPRPNLSRNGH